MSAIFVSGIGTGIGKTIVSAILCEALNADYWKPVQAGTLDNTDSDLVKKLVSNSKTSIHDERFKLVTACSPHLAAKIDDVEIRVSDFILPKTEKSLVIEGAGGLFVPLNEQELVVDLISHLKVPVVLISKNYLGSINHTLLSIEALRTRSIPILGVVFNGPKNLETERIILSFSKSRLLGRIFEEGVIDSSMVQKYATEFKRSLHELS